MKEIQVSFWTPGTKDLQTLQTIGCASHGFATASNWVGPEKGKHSIWEEPIKGFVYSGKYQNVLNNLINATFVPTVCLAFFRKPLGMEDFIQKFRDIWSNVPIIGGGAAVGDSQTFGDILPLAEDLVLLAASEGEFELESVNIYEPTDVEIEINKISNRGFNKIRLLPEGKWRSATDFYRQQQKIRGIKWDDFESLTFHDLNRRNIHCSIYDDRIVTGANLPDNCKLKLCEVNPKEATLRLSAFISVERSLIIGCAGIRSLIQEPLTTGKHSLAGFLFGELVTCNNQPMFGNLMLARLTRK